ncbi:MAG: class I SAM-dependent methyltransferase, partial [Dehalococcoidales bacterium]|nr:class I SAM-dependent methyltransferase [Dehalococcoidales bacterium]
AGIKPGSRVLDFGCGPGGYILPLAKLVGPSGEIIALDVNRLALRYVENIAFKNHLKNVRTVRSGLKTGLPDNSVDTVLLYDVFHQLSGPDAVLEELARVLKPEGQLSVSDHHLSENEIISHITATNKIILAIRGNTVYNFTVI